MCRSTAFLRYFGECGQGLFKSHTPNQKGPRNEVGAIDLKIDYLDRVSTKIVATFAFEHAIRGTSYGPK